MAIQFSQLFHKYIKGEANAEEVDRLMEMINQAEYDPRLKALLEEAWIQYSDELAVLSQDEAADILEKVLHTEAVIPERKGSSVYRILGWSVAAAVVLTAGLLWLFNNQQSVKTAPAQIASNNTKKDISPGTNTAVLMIGEGSMVVLDSASDGLLDRSLNGQIIKQDSLISYRHVQHTGGSVRYDKIVTPLRGTYQLELSDGTKVWLNAASSLRFPVVFTGEDRTVEVTGEAYFDVAHNPNRHFVVKVMNNKEPVTVIALGTGFNVSAYGDEENIRTTLVNGIVKVTASGKEKTLKPGQQLTVSDKDKLELKTVETDRVVAWKNGIFDFEEDHLRDILRQLGRWYGVQVEGQVPDKYLTGVVRRNVNLSEVLKMLESATKGVGFTIEENSIKVSVSEKN
ncbi:MAG: FecR family protein [Pseudobacter sp.]|uniref:FecR family protein n=1 Tax=Pseudobacter sp. TaxID=2045420 RepID=UPI003F7DC02E